MTLPPPLFSFTLLLGGGIITGWYAESWLPLIHLFLLVILVLLLGRRPRQAPKLTGMLLFFALGLSLGAREARIYSQGWAVVQNQAPLIRIVGTVTKPPSPWRNGSRFYLRVERLNGEDLTTTPLPQWEVFSESPQTYEYGQRLELTGRVFGAPTKQVTAWTRARITCGFFVRGTPRLCGSGEVNPCWRLANQLRRQLLAVGEKTLTPEAAAVLHGMLLGVREDNLPVSTFERVGILHLLSVSGLHLLFWLGLFWGIGKIFRLPDPLLAGLAVPVISLFILMAGAGAPVLRAGIMALLALGGELVQRPTRASWRLVAAAGGIMLLRPLEIFAPGFWLSFAACTGIIMLYPRWEQVVARSSLSFFLKPLLFSCAAQLMVLPLTIKWFGGFSLLAPLSNLILVPLGGFAVQLGLLAALIGVVYLPAAMLLNAGNNLLIQFFLKMIALFDQWPGYISLPPWPWMTVVAFYVIIGILTWGMEVNPINKRRRIPLFYLLLTLGLIGLLATGYFLVEAAQPQVRVVFFDVGQGDAALITVPGGYHLLIDGGEARGYTEEIKPYLQEQGIRRLDLVIVTHPHEDHLGGVVRLLEDRQIQVDQVLTSGMPHTTNLYRKFLELLLERKIPLREGVRGTTLRLGPVDGVVLHPPAGYLQGVDSELNNNSLVLLLRYGGIRLLLTGDVEKAGEATMIRAYGESLRANLLKVGHHGSSTSTGEDWLAQVAPEIAVISVGAGNSFGHPSPATLSRLTAGGTVVYRTDQHGRLTAYLKNSRIGRRTKIMVKRGVN